MNNTYKLKFHNYIPCFYHDSTLFYCLPSQDQYVKALTCTSLSGSICESPPLYLFVGVMVIVLATYAVDFWFKPHSVQTKDYKYGICCFSAKHAALRTKCKDWLAQNQNNVIMCQRRATCLHDMQTVVLANSVKIF